LRLSWHAGDLLARILFGLGGGDLQRGDERLQIRRGGIIRKRGACSRGSRVLSARPEPRVASNELLAIWKRFQMLWPAHPPSWAVPLLASDRTPIAVPVVVLQEMAARRRIFSPALINAEAAR
jgi:hypothetical protein